MTIAARDLITDAMRTLGVLASGEVPSADMAQDALRMLNYMIDLRKNTSTGIYAVQSTMFATQGGKGTYTLGPGGDWDIPRPTYIEDIRYRYDDQDLEWPMARLTPHEYWGIYLKGTQSTLPHAWFDDGAFPMRNIALYFIPSTSRHVVVHSWVLLDNLMTIDDAIFLPEGYELWLRYELAKHLAPEYEQAWTPQLEMLRQEVEGVVRQRNRQQRIEPVWMDPALRPGRRVGTSPTAVRQGL